MRGPHTSQQGHIKLGLQERAPQATEGGGGPGPSISMAVEVYVTQAEPSLPYKQKQNKQQTLAANWVLGYYNIFASALDMNT